MTQSHFQVHLPQDCCFGLPEMDQQHEQLLLLSRQVRELSVPDRDPVWREFVGALEQHFDAESLWMRQANFPDARLHERDHLELQTAAQASWPSAPSDQEIESLKQRLLGHLRSFDAELAQFLQNREAWKLRQSWETAHLHRRAKAL